MAKKESYDIIRKIKDIEIALRESVQLQSHYAKLLNQFDRWFGTYFMNLLRQAGIEFESVVWHFDKQRTHSFPFAVILAVFDPNHVLRREMCNIATINAADWA